MTHHDTPQAGFASAGLIERWLPDPDDENAMLDRGWFCPACEFDQPDDWEDNAVKGDQMISPPTRCDGCGREVGEDSDNGA